MRNPEPFFSSRILTQAAFVAILAVTAASCSNSLRGPLFTGSTQNQKEIIGGGNSVAQAPLPPPPTNITPATDNATPVAYAAPTSSATPGATSHKVQVGDTLYSISRQYGVSVGDLVALNGLDSAGQIRVGQTLTLPAGANPAPTAIAQKPQEKPAGQIALASADPKQTLTAPAAKPSTQTSAQQPAVPAAPSIPVETGKNEANAEMANAAIDAADADPPSANGTSFRWPVRGRIISGFGSKASGERNDGINLAVPEGTSVKAAEAGTVIYAGNELEGYGNLVLVRHADGWVSAYAHNKDIMVKRGDKVRRGQTIGEAGMSGSVSSPQVHFELRKGSKPVNPLDYLAGA